MFSYSARGIHLKVKVVIRNTWVSYMSGNFESTQARNTLFEGKKCEGKFLSDLGHKMATSGYFWGFPSVIDI